MNAGLYNDAAEALGARIEAEELAEWHGTATGILCAAPASAVADRLLALGPPGEPAWSADGGSGRDPASVPGEGATGAFDAASSATQRDAQEVLAGTQAALDGDAVEFEPLLLDSTPLTERALALAAWCQGFLVGLATTFPDVMRHVDGEAREALQDFSELALAVRGSDDAQEAESAYVELVEFLRVGVLLVHDALRTVRHPAAAGAGQEARGAENDESA
jgi:uncharacterized protein YgfB (UPF0149 family)